MHPRLQRRANVQFLQLQTCHSPPARQMSTVSPTPILISRLSAFNCSSVRSLFPPTCWYTCPSLSRKSFSIHNQLNSLFLLPDHHVVNIVLLFCSHLYPLPLSCSWFSAWYLLPHVLTCCLFMSCTSDFPLRICLLVWTAFLCLTVSLLIWTLIR